MCDTSSTADNLVFISVIERQMEHGEFSVASDLASRFDSVEFTGVSEDTNGNISVSAVVLSSQLNGIVYTVALRIGREGSLAGACEYEGY